MNTLVGGRGEGPEETVVVLVAKEEERLEAEGALEMVRVSALLDSQSSDTTFLNQVGNLDGAIQ